MSIFHGRAWELKGVLNSYLWCALLVFKFSFLLTMQGNNMVVSKFWCQVAVYICMQWDVDNQMPIQICKILFMLSISIYQILNREFKGADHTFLFQAVQRNFIAISHFSCCFAPEYHFVSFSFMVTVLFFYWSIYTF